MPFLQAGFDARNRVLGIRAMTRHERGPRGYKPAELRIFVSGDYFWYGANFLSWGEHVYFHNFFYVAGCWNLPQS